MKTNTFGKIIILVISLLLPIVALYGYSYQVSVNVVRQTVEESNINRLSFFMSQMELMIEQLTKFSVTAGRDFSLREYLNGRDSGDEITQLQRQLRIYEMLNMQTTTSAWNNQIILYLLDSKEVISTDYSVHYDDNITHSPTGQWTQRTAVSFGIKQNLFSQVRRSDIPNLLVEVRFTEDNLRNMLSLFKQRNQREPFLYKSGMDPIVSYTADRTLVNKTSEVLDSMNLAHTGSSTITIDGEKYIVNYILSSSLGWYLIDIMPIQSIFTPIVTSRNLFYSSIALLMALSILATLLLYRNVQIPIHLLIRGVQRIRDGQYSTRINKKANNEFDFLISSFNQMAEKIEELIDKVYKETLRSKEATLKQLQSQINPHFLYNCMFYIKNMANLGDKEAVTAMALNLGEYYRYTTRSEKTTSTIREEVKLIRNYLNIQQLRIQRFRFEIDIPEEMMEIEIPRLLIQPIVENAVIHGVEPSLQFGVILIKGERGDGYYRIVVDDNGPGITEERLEQIKKQISIPLQEETGCGLWNIHQRLVHQYEGKSGLNFSKSPYDGFRVEVIWEE
ncbi:sensor histidine kinase [Paenibacillus alkalitolerans]|uniref:sensor histidine kinase n=1 Tax=Paenibacillus alkalitolerans TaxID=2799335 RepID=UPI001F3D1B0D|nr:histidine kinase [Paenibacillus alkalitolerans]